MILFNLSGHGHFDLSAYEQFLSGRLEDRRQTRRARTHAVDEPVREAIRIRIVEDERELGCSFRHSAPAKLGRDVVSVAREP